MTSPPLLLGAELAPSALRYRQSQLFLLLCTYRFYLINSLYSNISLHQQLRSSNSYQSQLTIIPPLLRHEPLRASYLFFLPLADSLSSFFYISVPRLQGLCYIWHMLHFSLSSAVFVFSFALTLPIRDTSNPMLMPPPLISSSLLYHTSHLCRLPSYGMLSSQTNSQI